jgi:hypothetical protein
MKADKAYFELAEAMANSPIVPPCTNADPEAWFPEQGGMATHELRNVKALCSMCPAKAACLNYALVANEPWGVWGGLTTPERRRLKDQDLNRRPGRPTQNFRLQ